MFVCWVWLMTKTSVLSDKNLPLAIHLVAVFRFKDYYIFTTKKNEFRQVFSMAFQVTRLCQTTLKLASCFGS